MREWMLVGAGSFLGGCLRFGLSGLVQKLAPLGQFPLGTFAVNALGCLCIGLLGGLADSRHLFGPTSRLFVFLGLLGGFTTFSTFAYESLALVREGAALKAFVNVVGSVLVGLTAAWLGYALTAR